MFGRGYTIVDLDEFTREFYNLNGMERREAIAMPGPRSQHPTQPRLVPNVRNSPRDLCYFQVTTWSRQQGDLLR